MWLHFAYNFNEIMPKGKGVSGVNGSGERRKKRFKYDNFPRSFFVSFCDVTVCRLERTQGGRVMWGRSRT